MGTHPASRSRLKVPTGALYLDKPKEVATYEDIWNSVADQTLDEGQSLRLAHRSRRSTKMIDLSPARWRKSTRSGNNGTCVEVADNLPGVVAVRDSKDVAGPALIFDVKRWRAFVAVAKASGFGR
jgi:hypothetical protein